MADRDTVILAARTEAAAELIVPSEQDAPLEPFRCPLSGHDTGG